MLRLELLAAPANDTTHHFLDCHERRVGFRDDVHAPLSAIGSLHG
jgi:hypothetical protein